MNNVIWVKIIQKNDTFWDGTTILQLIKKKKKEQESSTELKEKLVYIYKPEAHSKILLPWAQVNSTLTPLNMVRCS